MLHLPQSTTASERVAISLVQGNNAFLRCLDEMKICDALPDEQELMACLDWNKLVPAFYTAVIQNKLLEDYFSSEFLLELKTYYRSSVLHSMQLEGVFRSMVPLLQKENIDIILFKGIVLAQLVYPTPTLRPMLDIDLLVEPNNVDKARQILVRAGCTPMYETESRHTMGHWRHIPPLVYRDIPIEIHQRLLLPHETMYPGMEEMAEKVIAIDILGSRFRTLSPEYHLFYLVYHLQKHALQGYIKLIWLLDIRLFLEKYQSALHTEELEYLTSGSKDIYHSFAAVQNILNCKLIKIPEDYPVKEIDKAGSLFLTRCNNKRLAEPKIKSFHVIRKRNTFKGKFLFIFGRLFPNTAYVRSIFHVRYKILTPFYYPVLYSKYLRKLIYTYRSKTIRHPEQEPME
ncbi:MAG TPA: nucleotidyltransferase family protein [Bacteroidales bacterium]